MSEIKTTCPGCGAKKDRRAQMCRACRPGPPLRGKGANFQFFLDAQQAKKVQEMGGNAWVKKLVLEKIQRT